MTPTPAWVSGVRSAICPATVRTTPRLNTPSRPTSGFQAVSRPRKRPLRVCDHRMMELPTTPRVNRWMSTQRYPGMRVWVAPARRKSSIHTVTGRLAMRCQGREVMPLTLTPY